MSEENEMWYRLMAAANNATRFRFPIDNIRICVTNGIYVLFEKGEKINQFDRITRIGINREQGNFIKRLEDHFEREIQRNSVFRKHYGRCLLNRKKDPYLQYWNFAFKSRHDKALNQGKVDLLYESKIEKEITAYIRQKVSFAVIEANDKKERKEFEYRLISTLASSGKNKPSSNWMGLFHPAYPYFSKTGLWNVQGINGPIVDEKIFKTIFSQLK